MPIQPNSVFLSYSVVDKLTAERFPLHSNCKQLRWWDLQTIPVGVDWAEFFIGQVSEAVCTIVLWSSRSVESKWVLREAEIALRRRVLIPVLIDGIPIPDAFSRIQTANLVDWDGDHKDPVFQSLIKSVRHSIETAPSSAGETRAFKQSQRSAERRAEEVYQQNTRSESTIEHVDLENTAFYDQLSWNLNASVNILLGRNGYGKTYLLRGMLALLQYHDDSAAQTMGNGSGSISLTRDGDEQLIHFGEQFFDEEGAVGKIPVLAIPDMRFINRSATTLTAVSDESTSRGDRADLARYGAWHFLEERPFESMIESFLYGLCLDYFERGLTFDSEQFELVRSVVRELTDSSFGFDRVAREGRDRFTLYVRTEGNEGDPLPIQKASQGTTSVIAMSV